MKVLTVTVSVLAALLVLLAIGSCSSGLGNNLPNPTAPQTSQASTNAPVGLDIGLVPSSPVGEAVVAGVVVPAIGSKGEQDVVLVAFTTAASAAENDGNGTSLSRDAVTDDNNASDVFVAAICAQDIDENAFSQSLAGKFRHPRCATCHSMSVDGTTAFTSAASIGQPHAGPLPGTAFPSLEPETCVPCHVEQTSAPVEGWQSPAESFDFRSKTVAELAQAAMNVPADEAEHFVTDKRVLWALDSGILPVTGGRNGVADDDHDGIDEPTDTDGIARPVPGGSEVFIEQIENWRNAGMPVSSGDAVCDVTLVSRATGGNAATTGASSRPQVVYVPNSSFSAPGTVGTLFVVYQSTAQLQGSDTDTTSDIYRTAIDLVADANGNLDLQVNGNAVLCTPSSGGGSSASGASTNPTIGGSNGQFVAFQSEATDLVSGFTAGAGSSNVYVREIGGSITLISHAEGDAATGADGSSEAPCIDNSGSAIAFESDATDLLATADGNGVRDVFFADISGAAPFARVRASVTSAGNEGSGGASRNASLNVGTGNRILVAFESDKTDLAAGLTAATNTFLFDSQSGATVLLNQKRSATVEEIGDGSARNPVIAADGSNVAFESDASNIDVLREDGNGVTDVFLVDAEQAAQGVVLPYRFSLTTVEATDADGPSTNPQFGTFASPSSSFQVGFAVYPTAATNLGTSDSTPLVVTFLDETSGVVAGFTASETAGPVPFTVSFTDQSTGVPTEWQWDFDNDGNIDSTEQNPSFTYTTPGTFTVSLVAANAASSNTSTRTDLIRAIGVPVTDFAATPVSGAAPLLVQFTDASTEQPTAWEWDFDNDGNVDSTDQNPSFTYTTPGTFAVSLTATNEAGSVTETKASLVQVFAPVVAGFTLTPASGFVPLDVTFANTSTGATSFEWDFDGDGNIDSTDASPTFQYTAAGSFDVTLIATGPGGSDSETQMSAVQAFGSVAANFTLSNSSRYVSQSLTLDASTSTGTITAFEWDFDNDLSTIEATGVNPTVSVGTNFPTTSQTAYTVRLRVTGSGGDTAVATLPFTSVADSETVEITPSADTIIYSDSTSNSNGAGVALVVGRVAGTGVRRALMQFDVDGNVPAGATINTAQLRVTNRSVPNGATNGTHALSIRRLTAAWTEGTADSAPTHGQGVATTGGGATFINRVSPSTAWSSAGGDFASASGSVTVTNSFTSFTSSSTSGLVSDVQGWLDTPANNFGWILIGNEGSTQTTKWLDSREASAADRPRLLLNITRALP
ncbi:MAG: PKD domain-containing protein [Planctomycetota bacterium]